MSTAFLADEALVDLLIEQATTGLGPAEQDELARRLALYPDADPGAVERVVVTLTLAARREDEPLPGALKARLIEQGTTWRAATPIIDLTERRSGAQRGSSTSRVRWRRSQAGWWAAAAALVLAVAGWYPRLAAPPRPPDARELRAQLIATTPGLIRWEFAATTDPAAHGASGDVVWDPVSQRGYMRFAGLGPNDARRSQYQLWIFDAERDDRFPVDGGVFDIPAGTGEVVIPIAARIRVGKPVLFAVTVERPGGVVVSGRKRVAVLAKPTQT
ncbi:MAG TPA: anti-sigma factor [Steroidobacteraceae bacterium]|nr:anti-sigma factor [Steroidobacteraceae bacterium]